MLGVAGSAVSACPPLSTVGPWQVPSMPTTLAGLIGLTAVVLIVIGAWRWAHRDDDWEEPAEYEWYEEYYEEVWEEER